MGLDGTYVTLSNSGFHYSRSQSGTSRKKEAADQVSTWIRHEDVIAELNQPPSRAPRQGAQWFAVIIVGIVLWIFHPLLTVFALIAGWTLVKKQRRVRQRNVSIYYDVDKPGLLERAMLASAACEALTRTQRVWVSGYRVGAFESHLRGPAVASRDGWPLLRTNLEVWTLAAVQLRLLFLPDCLLVVAHGAVTSFSYEELSIEVGSIDVVEQGAPAGDGQRIGTTYRHVTKSGRADLRYRDNPAFAVMRYGRLVLSSQRGLYLALQISRVDVAEYVARVLQARRAISASEVSQQRSVPPVVVSAARGETTALPVAGHAPSSGAEISHTASPRKPPIPAAPTVALQTSPAPVITAPRSVERSPGPFHATTPARFVEAQDLPIGSAESALRPSPRTAPVRAASPVALQVTPEPITNAPKSVKPPPRLVDAAPVEPPLRVAEPIRPSPATASWVPPGQSVRVGNWVIPDGMVYVGENLSRVSSYGCEPALIVPSAKCAPPMAASREDFGYWPSYSALTPEKRAAYLNWLAGGRKDPSAVLGCPFLFLYGIERRLLHDIHRDPNVANEVPVLLREVERLLSIYGPQSGSFLNYARGLIDFCRVYCQLGSFYEAEPPLEFQYEIPLTVKAALGQLVAEGKPIPARWALAWLMASPDVRFRTPARRCREEFITLFVHRYEQRFGEGILLRRNKSSLRLEYRPASASFGRPVELVARRGDETLPDVTRAKRQLVPLAKLADECMDALDAYSRALGPEPTRARRLRAMAYLPPELSSFLTEGPAAELSAWLRATVKGGSVLVSGAELIQKWLGSFDDKLGAKDAWALSSVFESLGHGVEPDPRFGGEAIRAGGHVALFSLPSGASAQPTGAYAVMGLWLRMATHVALSDGRLDSQEEALFHKRIDDATEADDATRRRLRAHLSWLLVEKPGLRGLGKRVEALPIADKQRIGQLAVAMAGVDGRIDPSEVRMLTRIYKLLGLEEAQLFDDIHELQATGDQNASRGPVRVREASASIGFAIPKDGAGVSGGFELDMAKVRRKEAESRAVAELLSDIFEGSEESNVTQPEPEEEPPEPDEPFSIPQSATVERSLLEELASKPSWARADFDALVQRYGMMPNAAVDSINELAIECSGDPVLIVDGNTVEIDAEIMHELMNDV